MTIAMKWKKDGFKKGVKKGIKRGIERGVKEGVKKGKVKGKIETARKMLGDGLSINVVSKYTGLPERYILKIKKKYL